MNNLLLENHLNMKFIPYTNKRNSNKKISNKPSDLAKQLANQTIKKINQK